MILYLYRFLGETRGLEPGQAGVTEQVQEEDVQKVRDAHFLT